MRKLIAGNTRAIIAVSLPVKIPFGIKFVPGCISKKFLPVNIFNVSQMIELSFSNPGSTPAVPVCTCFNHGNIAENSFLVHFAGNFVAHLLAVFMPQLKNDSRGFNGVPQRNRFFDCTCHRFFEVNVFTCFGCFYCHFSMGMIGSGNYDHVYFTAGNHFPAGRKNFYGSGFIVAVCRDGFPERNTFAPSFGM